MTATKYVGLLALALLLGFWRLTPWAWISRLARMPSSYLELLAFEPSDRLKAIRADLPYLAQARESGDIWMPQFIWRRIQHLKGVGS